LEAAIGGVHRSGLSFWKTRTSFEPRMKINVLGSSAADPSFVGESEFLIRGLSQVGESEFLIRGLSSVGESKFLILV